jgi:hydrogenase nickel incorporation protein HypA/HybF
MHELSIAMSILEVVQEETEKRGRRIEAIHLRVGALSGVMPEALLSAYELARENTEFASCRLLIEDVPVTGYCPACGTVGPVKAANWLCCSECGGPVANVGQGRELEVTALELSE